MGLLRIVLALSVIVGHSGTLVFGYKGVDAFYAVNVFFIVSGFYIALILNEKYTTPETNSIFLFNRVLRLYPVYLIGLALALVEQWHRGNISNLFGFTSTFSLLERFFIYGSNLTMLGQDLLYVFCFDQKGSEGSCVWGGGLSLNPPAWSISVEVVFYAIAPFVLRSRTRTLWFLAIGVTYAVAAALIPVPFVKRFNSVADANTLRYYAFPASFMFFAAGALAYHYIYKRRPLTLPSYPILALIVFALSLTSTALPWWHAVLFALAIPTLFEWTKRSKADRFVGDLSYSVYILHFPILLWVQKFMREPGTTGWPVPGSGNVTAVITVLMAVAVLILVEKPIDRFRQRNAARASRATISQPPCGTLIASP